MSISEEQAIVPSENNIENNKDTTPPNSEGNANEKQSENVADVNIKPKTRNLEEFFVWLKNINTSMRKCLRNSTDKIIVKILQDLIRHFRDDFHSIVRYPNRCQSLSRKIIQLAFLMKNLIKDYEDSDEFLYKMCDLLVNYTELELRNACKIDGPKIIIAERISKVYNLLLMNSDASFKIRILLQIRQTYKQSEIMSTLFEKYLTSNLNSKTALPDKQYMMNLFAYRRWRILETDDKKRSTILTHAKTMKPKTSFRYNSSFTMFLKIDNVKDENIAEYFLSRQNVSKQLFMNTMAREGFIHSLPFIIDLVADESQQEKPRCQIDINIFSSDKWNQNNITRVKTEKPEVVDYIDLTEDRKDPDLKYIETLIEKAKRLEPVCDLNTKRTLETEIICIDDDEICEQGKNLNINDEPKQNENDVSSNVCDSISEESSKKNENSEIMVSETTQTDCDDLDKTMVVEDDNSVSQTSQKILDSTENTKNDSIGNEKDLPYRSELIEKSNTLSSNQNSMETSETEKTPQINEENNEELLVTTTTSSTTIVQNLNIQSDEVEEVESNLIDTIQQTNSEKDDQVDNILQINDKENQEDDNISIGGIHGENESGHLENSSCVDMDNFLTNVFQSDQNEINDPLICTTNQTLEQRNSPDLYLFRDREDVDVEEETERRIAEEENSNIKTNESNNEINNASEDDDEIKTIAKKISAPPLKTYERKRKSKTTNIRDLNAPVKDNIVGLDPPNFSPFSSETESCSSSSIDVLNESVNQDINNVDTDILIPLINTTTLSKNEKICEKITLENTVVFSAGVYKRLESKKWKDPLETQQISKSPSNVIFSTSKPITVQHSQKQHQHKEVISVRSQESLISHHSNESNDEIRSLSVGCFSESEADEICELIGKNFVNDTKNEKFVLDSEVNRNLSNNSEMKFEVGVGKNHDVNVHDTLSPGTSMSVAQKRKSVSFADITQERSSSVINLISSVTDPLILDRKSYEGTFVHHHNNVHQPWHSTAMNKPFIQSNHHRSSLPINQQQKLSNNQQQQHQKHSISQQLINSPINLEASIKPLSAANIDSGFKTSTKVSKTRGKSTVFNSKILEPVTTSNNHYFKSTNLMINSPQITNSKNNWKITNFAIERKNRIDNILETKTNSTSRLDNKISSLPNNDKIASDFDRYLKEKRIAPKLKQITENVTEKNVFVKKKTKRNRRKSMNNTNISNIKHVNLKEFLCSFNDPKLIKKPVIELIPLQITHPALLSENLTKYQNKMYDNSSQVKIIDSKPSNKQNSKKISKKTIHSDIFVQVFKRKSPKLSESENRHVYVKLKRFKYLSNKNNVQVNENQPTPPPPPPQSSTVVNDERVSERYENNNLVKAKKDSIDDTIVSSSMLHYSVNNVDKVGFDQNRSYENQINDDSNIDERRNTAICSHSNKREDRISLNDNCATSVHNQDSDTPENVVSSSQDPRIAVTQSNEIVSSSTAEQSSEFVQNNQVDTSNPSLTHRTIRRRALLTSCDENLKCTTNQNQLDNFDLYTNTDTEESTNTPTTTTEIDIPNVNRKRGRQRKYSCSKSESHYKRKRKFKRTNRIGSSSSSRSLNKEYVPYLSPQNYVSNSNNAKTYSNCNLIKKIFVPPEVEQII